jgi:hypothetical protein
MDSFDEKNFLVDFDELYKPLNLKPSLYEND